MLVTRFYGTAQSEDHKKYFNLYAVNGTEDIGLTDRNQSRVDAWDQQPDRSVDENDHSYHDPALATRDQYTHVRQGSGASTVMGMTDEPFVHPNADPSYGHYPAQAQFPPDDTGYHGPGFVDGMLFIFHKEMLAFTHLLYPTFDSYRRTGP